MKFPKKAERMNLRIGTDIYFSNIKRGELRTQNHNCRFGQQLR